MSTLLFSLFFVIIIHMKREVESFAAVAHELKTPLAILRQLGLALESTRNPQETMRIQRQIVEITEQTLRQVNDLTIAARLNQPTSLVTEPVSVRRICNQVLETIQPFGIVKHHQIQTRYTNKKPLATANPELLYSIIYNFCTNAIRCSDQNSISKLTVSDHQSKIRIGVRDHGPALPAAIWRELNQGGISSPTIIAMRPDSSGLNLYVSSQFAHRMHATLRAVRHRDGTSFFVELPAAVQAPLW